MEAIFIIFFKFIALGVIFSNFNFYNDYQT